MFFPFAFLTAVLAGCGSDNRPTVAPTEPASIRVTRAPLLALRPTPPDSDARYIVILKDNVPNPAARARVLATQHAKITHHIYEHGVRGFAATLSRSEVLALQN